MFKKLAFCPSPHARSGLEFTQRYRTTTPITLSSRKVRLNRSDRAGTKSVDDLGITYA
jgi:hypothetical protein